MQIRIDSHNKNLSGVNQLHGADLVWGHSVLVPCFVGLASEVMLMVLEKWQETEWAGTKRRMCNLSLLLKPQVNSVSFKILYKWAVLFLCILWGSCRHLFLPVTEPATWGPALLTDGFLLRLYSLSWRRDHHLQCVLVHSLLFSHHGFSNPNHLPRHSYLLQEVLLTPSSPNPHPKLKVFSFLWSPITVWVHCGYGFFSCYLSTCSRLPLIAGSCSDSSLSLSRSTLDQGSTYGQGCIFRTWFWPLAHWKQNPKPLVNLKK